MNIYEDEELEEKLQELTDQIGHLFLDMLLVSLKKLNHENIVYKEFEEARRCSKCDNVPF